MPGGSSPYCVGEFLFVVHGFGLGADTRGRPEEKVVRTSVQGGRGSMLGAPPKVWGTSCMGSAND